jgi:hypothetical protein
MPADPTTDRVDATVPQAPSAPLGAEEALRLLDQSAVATAKALPRPSSFWKPTLADFLFLSLVIWLFLAGPNGWNALLADGDTGWHIRVGDWIRQHGAVPHQDFLSFSKEGARWYAWEWGAELFMSWLHGWAGMKGVVLGLGMLIPAYLLVVFRHSLWRGATPLAALPVLLLCSGSSAIHYLARPHLFTLLFLSAALWMIDADRRQPSWRLWLLIPLIVVWANLHGGFLALVACLGLVAGGERIARRYAEARRYAMAAALCLLATLVNPYGYHLHEHILGYLRSDWIRSVVDEFQSPSFRSEAMLVYECVLVLSLLVLFRRVRAGQWADAALVIGWAHLSLGAVRHVPVFLLVASPILAAELTCLWNEHIAGLSKRAVLRTFDALSRDLLPRFAANSIWVVVPVLLLACMDKPIAWPDTFPEAKFPVRFIESHQGVIAGKRVLTTDEWGDYLSYRFYPRQRVFFDGRSDFFGPELGKDYLALMSGGAGAEARLERFGFEVALLPREWNLYTALRKNSGWEFVAEDERAALFRSRLKP